jgi:hypothetical protein
MVNIRYDKNGNQYYDGELNETKIVITRYNDVEKTKQQWRKHETTIKKVEVTKQRNHDDEKPKQRWWKHNTLYYT